MQAAYSISLVTVLYIIYYFLISDDRVNEFFTKKHGFEGALKSTVFFQRLLGTFLFGVVTVVFALSQGLDLTAIGLGLESKHPIWHWILGLGLLCTLINFFAAKKPDHLAMYPQIRTPQPWNKYLLFNSALTLFLYTLGYEIMFRGYLLFTCFEEMGAVNAIVINTAIYALVHLPKGWKETVGTFPMGIVLSWLTLESGNIWIAVAVHVALAWSSEWFSIYYGNKKSLA